MYIIDCSPVSVVPTCLNSRDFAVRATPGTITFAGITTGCISMRTDAVTIASVGITHIVLTVIPVVASRTNTCVGVDTVMTNAAVLTGDYSGAVIDIILTVIPVVASRTSTCVGVVTVITIAAVLTGIGFGTVIDVCLTVIASIAGKTSTDVGSGDSFTARAVLAGVVTALVYIGLTCGTCVAGIADTTPRRFITYTIILASYMIAVNGVFA